MKTHRGIACLLALIAGFAPRAASAFLCVEPIRSTLTLQPESLDVGSAAIGGSKTLTVSVTYSSNRTVLNGVCTCNCSNASSATLTLSYPSASSFSVSPSSLTLADGATGNFTITFHPTGAQGIYTDTLTIQSPALHQALTPITTGVGFTGQSNINVDVTNVDFAGTEVGTTRTKYVNIINEGTLPLVGSVATDSPFSVMPSSFNLQPGSTLNAMVQFRPTATGPAAGELRIQSNDLDAPFIAVALQGTGIEPYADLSTTALDFGTIPVNESLIKYVKITNLACSSCGDSFVLNLSNFEAPSDFIVTPPSDTSLDPGQSVSIPVTYAPTSTGSKTGKFKITTNDPLNTTLQVDVAGRAANSSLDPSVLNLNFGDTHLGSPKTLVFSIRNKGTSSLSINGVTPPSSRILVTPTSATLAAGVTQNFQVTYTPTATSSTTLPNETLGSFLNVASNDAGIPSLKIDLSGRGVSPVMSVTPIETSWVNSLIDLGTVYVGDTRTYRLRVSNTGNEALNIGSITSSLPAISPLVTSLTVPPMTSSEFDVRYQPTSEGSHQATLTFAGNDYFMPTYPAGLKGNAVSSLDLSVSKIEATQSIQNQNQDLPLVANKATAVRAFIASTIRGNANTGDIIRKVDGLLRIFKNGTQVAGSPFLSVNGPIGVVPSPSRNDASQTLNFLIPPGVLSSTQTDEWTARVEINPASGARAAQLKESRYDNNALEESLTFFDNYKPTIYYVPMSINGDPLPPDNRMIEGKRLMEKIFPIPGVNYMRRPPIALNVDVTYANVGKILQAVFFAAHMGNVPPPDRTYGWFPLNYSSPDNFRGYSEGIPGRVAVGGELSSIPAAQETFAHEMGHTYGLCHTNTDVSDSCPSGYTDEHVPADQDVADVGFDVDNQTAVVASKDLMTIKTLSKRWIHPKRYQFLFDRLRTKASDPADARGLCYHQPANCVSLLQPVKLVAGTFADDGSAELHPVVSSDSIPDEPAEDFSTPYALRLLDESGNQIGLYPLNASEETGLDGPTLEDHVFSLVIPDDDRLHAIQILRGTQVLAERKASAHLPLLALNPPSLGESLEVSWTASDEDGDSLLSSVLYSSDGGNTFRAIGIDLTTTRFAYDAAKLPGGAAVVRVVVTDGFHTVSADSELFTVATKAPSVHLLAPTGGQTIFAGMTFTAEAEANDTEDGPLDGDALRWESNLAGFLGTGRSLDLKLPAGHHVLKVTAKDSEGKSVSVTTDVSIEEATSAPRANAGEDQRVPEDSMVTLDASATTDPDEGDQLRFEWTQVSGPSVLLDDNLSSTPVFLAPMVAEDTQIRFRLTVTDANGNTGSDFIDVIAENVFYSSLRISDSLLDFGTSGVGQPVSKTVTISNQGNETLVIKDAVAPRADFFAEPKAFSLEPGQSRVVTITFEPTEEAIFDSYVRFVSNSVAGVSTRVLVTGRTPNPKVHYDDNGVGASLLPGLDIAASESPLAPNGSASAKSSGGCALIP